MKYASICIFSTILMFLHTSYIFSQLPKTNIYTLDLQSNEKKVLLRNLQYISDFNAEGYNNQPHFINKDELLITSSYKSSGLTDIWHLNIPEEKVTRITSTVESEYSPMLMPDGINFSIILQQLPVDSIIPQVLWSYPLDRTTSGELLIHGIDNIGYHIWVSSSKVALYLVGEPSELVLYDINNKSTTHIAYDAGRCLKVDQSSNLYYIQKSGSQSTIRSYDIYLGRSRRIAPALKDQQDFDVLPNGHLISADGPRLMTFTPFLDSTWRPNLDFSSAGISKISRISSSVGRVAIVTVD